MAKSKSSGLSQDQLSQLRAALGIGSEIPDSDIAELAGTKAGQAILNKVKGQGQMSFWDRFKAFGEGGVNALEQYKGTREIEGLVDKLAGTKPKKAADPAKAKTKPLSQQDALAQLAQLLTSGYVQQGEIAMGQEGQALAQQNAAVTGVVDQYLTGNGVNSGNPAVQAAMGAYAKAYSAGEALNSAAYGNMGIANAQYLASSPAQPIVNLLTQSLGSTQYKELPPSLVAALPQSVRQALAGAGITETLPSGSTGGTPIPTGKTSTSNNLSSLLTGIINQGAGNPNLPVNPQAPTNPNTPGA